MVSVYRGLLVSVGVAAGDEVFEVSIHTTRTNQKTQLEHADYVDYWAEYKCDEVKDKKENRQGKTTNLKIIHPTNPTSSEYVRRKGPDGSVEFLEARVLRVDTAQVTDGNGVTQSTITVHHRHTGDVLRVNENSEANDTCRL